MQVPYASLAFLQSGLSQSSFLGYQGAYEAGNEDGEKNAVDCQHDDAVNEVVRHHVDATVERRVAPPPAVVVVTAAGIQVERADVDPGVGDVGVGQQQPAAVAVVEYARPVVDADDLIQRVNPHQRPVLSPPPRAGYLTRCTLLDR